MVFRAQRLRARVGDHETPCPVGALRHARLEARLPDQRGLLVAGDAAYRHLSANAVVGRHAEVGGTIAHLGQQRARHAEHREQRIIPFLRMNIEQQCAGRIGCVRCMDATFREPP